jgi:cyclophilin family peptidyl-prolyl cis-trans isomerase/HEAT repeat protein
VLLPAWGRPFVVRERPLTEQLRRAELARDLADPSIAEALASGDPELQTQGVWTVSRIGGEGALALLLPTLDAVGAPSVDRSAVFSALALLEPPNQAPGAAAEPAGAWRDLEDALWTRYAVTNRATEVRALLLSISRIGGQRSSARLAVDLAPMPAPGAGDRYHDAMEALGVLCARGHALSSKGLDAVAQGLGAPDPLIRNGAAYALGRCAGPSAELLAGPERAVLVKRLQPMVESSGNADGARLAWRALAALGESPEPVPEAILADPELPWQVEVQAVRALGGNAKGRKLLVGRLSTLDLGALEGPRIHGVLEALRVLRPSITGTPELLEPLKAFERKAVEAWDRVDARDRRGVAHALCEVYVLEAIGSGKLEKLLRCADDRLSWPEGYVDGLAVEALLHMDTSEEAKFAGLRERAEGGRTSVAARALDALAEVEDPQVNAVLRAALGRRDVGVVAAAASAIAARSADSDKRDLEAVDALATVIRELGNDDAVEARIAAVEALGSLARGGVSSAGAKDASGTAKPQQSPPAPWLATTILPLADDPNAAVRRAARNALWGHDVLRERFEARMAVTSSVLALAKEVKEAVAAATRAPALGLFIHTEKGVIEVGFGGAQAPVGQQSLAALAERGYFDGLRWHRVVPDFVIQGGDPRGDGYGGPGYTLPCEWSNLAYERGTVGIALAGKDTGGSQIFITHSRQPHLDGRYTVIGRVRDGLDVLDRIVGQDVIERVEVVRARP